MIVHAGVNAAAGRLSACDRRGSVRRPAPGSSLIETPPAEGTQAQQASSKKSQRARFGNRDGSEQPVRLPVNAIGEIKRIGVAVVAANAKVEGPQATGRIAAARIHLNRPLEGSGRGFESVDDAVQIAEIPDQEIATKF